MLAKQSVTGRAVALVCLLGTGFAGPVAAQPDPGQPAVPSAPRDPSDAPGPGEPADPSDAPGPGEPADPSDAPDPGEPADPSDAPDPGEPADPSDAPDRGQPADPPGVPPPGLTPPSGPVTVPPIDPQAAEEALGLTQEQRRLIQRGLAEVGFDPGAPDGLFGGATRAQIRLWQGARGEEPTGYLTARAAADLQQIGRLGRQVDELEGDTASAEEAREAAQAAAADARRERDAERAQGEATREQAAAERVRYVRWLVVSLAGAAAVLLLIGVVGYRSLARAKQRRARAELLAQSARSDLAQRAARDRAADAVPAVFLDGADENGRPIALRVPGNAIAAEEGAVVGRNPFDSSVVIDHPEVSRRHFRLFADGASVLVEDLNSMNGTRLNDEALEPGAGAPLLAGAVLQVGELSFTVTLQG